MCSNANSNPPASSIGQKLSPGGTSIVLPVVDILLKKLAWRQKTNTKKRTALFHYIYAFVNEEKGYL